MTGFLIAATLFCAQIENPIENRGCFPSALQEWPTIRYNTGCYSGTYDFMGKPLTIRYIHPKVAAELEENGIGYKYTYGNLYKTPIGYALWKGEPPRRFFLRDFQAK